MEVQLMSAIDTIDELKATVQQKDEELQFFVEKVEIQQQLRTQRETKGSFFTFDDLFSDRALAKHVGVFTYLPTADANNSFLEALDYAEGCDPDGGLCQNLVRYSTTSFKDRKCYQAEIDGGNESDVNSDDEGEKGLEVIPSLDSDDSLLVDDDPASSDSAYDDLEYTSGSSFEEDADKYAECSHGGIQEGSGRKRKVDWKTEWLIYNCYV
eukprot:scaffold93977_cov62-Attheya_sp.AAC.1